MRGTLLLRLALVVGLASVMLTGCGQKGPLYLPQQNHAHAKNQNR